MATYHLLVRNTDGGLFKKGDVVKVATGDHVFGALELEMHRVIPVESDEFYNIWNLDEQLETNVTKDWPTSIKRSGRNYMKTLRARRRDVLSPSRYRIDENDKLIDKSHE